MLLLFVLINAIENIWCKMQFSKLIYVVQCLSTIRMYQNQNVQLILSHYMYFSRCFHSLKDKRGSFFQCICVVCGNLFDFKSIVWLFTAKIYINACLETFYIRLSKYNWSPTRNIIWYMGLCYFTIFFHFCSTFFIFTQYHSII